MDLIWRGCLVVIVVCSKVKDLPASAILSSFFLPSFLFVHLESCSAPLLTGTGTAIQHQRSRCTLPRSADHGESITLSGEPPSTCRVNAGKTRSVFAIARTVWCVCCCSHFFFRPPSRLRIGWLLGGVRLKGSSVRLLTRTGTAIQHQRSRCTSPWSTDQWEITTLSRESPSTCRVNAGKTRSVFAIARTVWCVCCCSHFFFRPPSRLRIGWLLGGVRLKGSSVRLLTGTGTATQQLKSNVDAIHRGLRTTGKA